MTQGKFRAQREILVFFLSTYLRRHVERSETPDNQQLIYLIFLIASGVSLRST
jgi:hypothetical protein